MELDKMEWQPIETAPRDGTWFIGRRGNEVFTTQASYGSVWVSNGKGGHVPDPKRKTFSWLASHYDSLMPWHPTYWMSLEMNPAGIQYTVGDKEGDSDVE